MDEAKFTKSKRKISVSIDGETSNIIEELKKELKQTQSEVIRNAIKFYFECQKKLGKDVLKILDRLRIYIDLLSEGEHIILDVDHYILFLRFIENSQNKHEFFELNQSIGKAHGEEFNHILPEKSVKEVLDRLKICNFFNIIYESANQYTLLLGSEIQKTFIKTFLEEILIEMGFNVEIREGFSKLIIRVLY